MKFKKLLFLIAVLAVLVVAGLVKRVHVQKAEQDQQKAAVAVQPLLKSLETSEVSKLSCQAGDDDKGAVLLRKQESGDWVVESHFGARAKKWQVDQLLKNVSSAKGELRSDSAEVLGDYRLLENQAVHLRFFGASGKELCHLLISPERAPAWQNFVRLAGSKQVLLISGDLLSNLGVNKKEDKPDPKNFTDLQAVKLDVSKVTKIETNASKTPWTLVKTEDKEKKKPVWNFEPPAPGQKEEVDPDKVSNFISSLTRLNGQSVLDPKAAGYGFDEKPFWIRLSHTKDDKPVQTELYLGKPDAEKKTAALKVMPEGLVYEVNGASTEAVKTDRANFVKEGTPKKSEKK